MAHSVASTHARARQLRGLAIAAHYYRREPAVYDRGIITEGWRARHRKSYCCRWCGERVLTLKRWHAPCLKAYAVARGEAKTRDKTKVIEVVRCVRCGKTRKEMGMEVDHIIPLGLARLHGVRAYVRAHLIDNLQPLCAECHRRKTADDRACIWEAKQRQLTLWGGGGK